MLAVLGDGDVVYTGAGPGHRQQRLGNFHALQLLAAQHEGIRVADIAAHFVVLA